MEEFAKMLEEQKDAKKYIDRVGMNYLCDEDLLVCDYVANQLVNMEISNINCGKRISLENMVEQSLDEMKIFGSDIENKTLDLLSKTRIKCNSNKMGQFGTAVNYAYDKNDCIIPDSGIISFFAIPSKLTEISVYLFSHELLHAMKETNYMEHKDVKTLGETIPLFYELMIYSPDEVLKKEILKFRMFWLLNDKEEYLYISEMYGYASMIEEYFGISKDKKSDIGAFMRTKIGCYLNSFYYAVILYNMYKENPKKILDLISRVLKHEITTLQMLEILDIYGDIKGSVFEKELKGIKKVLK